MWCDDNNINADTASLEELYQYKKDSLSRNIADSSAQELIQVIKLYYQAIKRVENPTLLMKHRKRQVNLPNNLLSENDLKTFYQSLSIDTFIQMRDKVMFGLTIFQGIKREELLILEPRNVNLEEGTIYIPACTKTNARTIDLHPIQIQHLMDYCCDYRDKLLSEAPKNTDKLFFTMGTGHRLDNALYGKIKELKQSHSSFKSMTQIRESRMAIWVKTFGVRKAQYSVWYSLCFLNVKA